MSTAGPTSTTTTEEWRGPVLEVVRQLLDQHERSSELLAIFAKLVARNSELESRLGELLARQRKGEGVSAAQLLLLLNQPQASAGASPSAEAGPELAPCSPAAEAANQQLRAAAGVDELCRSPSAASPPPPQPSIRQPFPEQLERVPEPIAVSAQERKCPVCGAERECIGHDIVEVADLKPAEVFVRVEMREKLRCKPCEGEIVRAPVGDRVVSGGRYGSRLVAQLLVDKYDDGLPLHRQKQRFERMGLPVAVSTLADQVTWVTDLLAVL